MSSLDEQLSVLGSLSMKVHTAFMELRVRETDYLNAVEAHHDARETLARAIDVAYDQGEVIGKNEREREAHLRRLLPVEHNEEARLEALMRGVERDYRANLRDAERLTLQVHIARLVFDAQKANVLMVPIGVPHPEGGFAMYGHDTD